MQSLRRKFLKTANGIMFPVFTVFSILVQQYDADDGHDNIVSIRRFPFHCLITLFTLFILNAYLLGLSFPYEIHVPHLLSLPSNTLSLNALHLAYQTTILHPFLVLIINSISRMSSSNNDPIKKMKNISIPFMRKSCHAFIKQVKDASSAEEERVLIANESSNIRSDFGQQKTTSLREDLTKLIFIYLLGYPAHFGQMACLQLISSPVFQDKRIGYLAMNLFIHESNDILLLTVNSIKNDIRSSNMYRLPLDC